MSVQDEKEAVELPHHGDLAFSALMDALAPEASDAPAEGAGSTDGTGAGADGLAAGGAAGGAATGTGRGGAGAAVGDGSPAGGSPAAAGSPAGADPKPAAGDAGAAGGDAQPAGAAATGDPAGDAAVSTHPAVPANWTANSADLVPHFGELSTKFEENVTKAYQQQAYDTAREEYGQYFEALEKHPRLLVGTQVPAIGKEGMETLRNSEDAKEWQEAVKSLLVAEIREQATAKMEESADFMQTVHASIDLFKNNPDLIPGTKGFNVDLANTFAQLMAPYEVRVDGKLQGYSVPTQPIIDGLRKQILTPAPPNPPAAAAAPAAAPAPRPTPEPPQAGIQSKASSGAEREDFSTLFGTIGLPNLQI